jgi:hypothetical protein
MLGTRTYAPPFGSPFPSHQARSGVRPRASFTDHHRTGVRRSATRWSDRAEKQAQATHHHGVVEAIASRGGSRGPSMLTTNVFGIGSVRETLKQVGQERQAACPNTTPRAGPLHKAPYAQCTVLVWPDGVPPVGQLGVWKWPVRQCASAELHSWFFVLCAGSRTVSRHMHALYCSCTVTGWKSWIMDVVVALACNSCHPILIQPMPYRPSHTHSTVRRPADGASSVTCGIPPSCQVCTWLHSQQQQHAVATATCVFTFTAAHLV